MLGEQALIQSFAMLLGILSYASLYVFIESRESIRRILESKSLRIALKVGYGTRIAISIIFPLAIYIDVMCGVASVGLMTTLFGESPLLQSDSSIGMYASPAIFLWFYVTTLVQGTLMNLVLGTYILIVYAITVVCRAGNRG